MKDRIRILVGYDNSLQSKKALKEAITIAELFSGFIKVVNVYERDKKKAESAILEAEEDLQKEKVAHESLIVLDSNPAKALVVMAKKENFDLIAVGKQGLGTQSICVFGERFKAGCKQCLLQCARC